MNQEKEGETKERQSQGTKRKTNSRETDLTSYPGTFPEFALWFEPTSIHLSFYKCDIKRPLELI